MIKKQGLRDNINNKCKYFVQDNFLYQIILFYTTLFNDQNIANPELKENFINKIHYFTKKKKFLNLYESNEDLLELLIKGLLKYMAIENMCHYASEIMVKIIKPSCFGQNLENFEKMALINVTKKFFENNVDTFHEFMDNYNKLINKVMTDYTLSLTEAANVLIHI